MRKWFALVLGAALLAGCAAGKAESAAPSAAESTVQSETVTEAMTPAPTEASLPAADTKAEQTAVLDQFVAFGADTAGGSLKTTKAAAALVEYLSYADLETDVLTDWRAGLSDDEQAMLELNWPGILAEAQAICSDPAAQADQLATAGVETDFPGMVLTAVPDKLAAVDTVLGGKAG